MTATLNAAPDVTIEEVSPQTAREWLGHNQRNRSLRGAVVNRYARDMEKGRWRFNGEPIQFDTAGTLLNGQHRLNAIIQSETTQRFVVIRGLPPEAHETLDTGAKRTPGDVLALAGYSSSTILATMARIALQVEANPGLLVMQRGYTTAEIIARIERDPGMVSVVSDVLPSLTSHNLMPNSVLAFCYWRLAQENPTRAHEFFDGLLSLVGLPAGSPILALNRRLTQHAASRNKSARHQFEIIAYVFLAWNAWRRDEDRVMIKLGYNADGRLNIPTPV